MFIGRKIEVGLGKESSRGTVVTPTYWLFKTSASLITKPTYATDEASAGNISDSLGARITFQGAEGEIAGKVTDRSMGLLLLASFGSLSSALKGGESVVYEHTFSLLNSNSHPTLTVEMKDDNEQKAYANAVIDSLKISAEIDKYVTFAASFKAKAGVTASNTPSYLSTENDFIATEATVKLANNLAGLGAASAIAVKSIEISIDKDSEYIKKLGSIDPSDVINQKLSISGNIEANYADITTLKNLFTAGTYQAIRIAITSGTGIGTSSFPTLKLDIAKCSFQDWSRPSENDKLVTQTIKFKGHLSLSDSAIASGVLTNLVASY